MNIFGIVLGILIVVIGLYILVYTAKIANLLQIRFDDHKKKYDERISKTKGINTLITFLIFKPRTYYMHEGDSTAILKFFSLLLIILGLSLALLGFGVIK